MDERGNPADASVTPLHFPAALTLAAADAVAGDYRPAIPAAAAIELVYNFVLVHNDVQAGRVDPNRDRPSIWWVWGPSQAINAGDGLHALARSVLMRLSESGSPDETVLAALRALDRACLTLCEGQYMDLMHQDELMVTEAAYLDMIERKAGALAGCAAELGALAAGADDDTGAALRQWGANLGMALQIYADVADLWGARGDGFTPSNVLNKKKSLPLIHSLERAPTAAKRELGGIYMKRVLEPDDARRIVAILDEQDSRRYAEDAAQALIAAAVPSVADAAALTNPPSLEWAAQLVTAGNIAALV